MYLIMMVVFRCVRGRHNLSTTELAIRFGDSVLTPNTVSLTVVDPNGSSPRVSPSNVRADGVLSEVKIESPDDGGKFYRDELGKASEQGGQDVVRVSPPTTLQPLGKGSPNQLRTEPPETRADVLEERGGATEANSSQVPSKNTARPDGSWLAGTEDRFFWRRTAIRQIVVLYFWRKRDNFLQ